MSQCDVDQDREKGEEKEHGAGPSHPNISPNR